QKVYQVLKSYKHNILVAKDKTGELSPSTPLALNMSTSFDREHSEEKNMANEEEVISVHVQRKRVKPSTMEVYDIYARAKYTKRSRKSIVIKK
ncbi:hypothetical protein Tco_0866785, partial [Tanacetum coccineum]